MGKQLDTESYDQFHLLRKGELMEKTICFACIEDSYLKEIIKTEGTPLKCSVCDEDGNNAITVKDLGKLMEPIMREHFSLGESIRMFGEEEDWWNKMVNLYHRLFKNCLVNILILKNFKQGNLI